MDQDTVYQFLLESAYRFVSFRPRSEKEFHDFLAKKIQKFKITNPDLMDKVLTKMQDLGYLDDQKFVAWWVEQREAHRPKGARLIKQELIAKGIDKNLLEETLSTGSQSELAKRTVKKILYKLEKLPRIEKRKKIYEYLARRGFNGQDIFAVIDEIVGKR